MSYALEILQKNYIFLTRQNGSQVVSYSDGTRAHH